MNLKLKIAILRYHAAKRVHKAAAAVSWFFDEVAEALSERCLNEADRVDEIAGDIDADLVAAMDDVYRGYLIKREDLFDRVERATN